MLSLPWNTECTLQIWIQTIIGTKRNERKSHCMIDWNNSLSKWPRRVTVLKILCFCYIVLLASESKQKKKKIFLLRTQQLQQLRKPRCEEMCGWMKVIDITKAGSNTPVFYPKPLNTCCTSSSSMNSNYD